MYSQLTGLGMCAKSVNLQPVGSSSLRELPGEGITSLGALVASESGLSFHRRLISAAGIEAFELCNLIKPQNTGMLKQAIADHVECLSGSKLIKQTLYL